MDLRKTFLIISTTLFLICCKEKQSELKFEESVLCEILPALVDSLDFDFRIAPPPPPKPIFNEKWEIIGIDTTGSAKVMADYEKRIAEFKADSILVIAVDSVRLLELTDGNDLLSHFYSQNLSIDSTEISTGYKIDLKKLEIKRKLMFKHRSEFPKDKEIWKKEYPFQFGGVLFLSRIQFDKTKSFGVFESGMIWCGLCGGGIRAFIRKVNGKWLIDKIEETWIS